MKYLITFLLAVCIFKGQAQVTLNGVTLPAKLTYGQSNLTLNGGGVRIKLIFKLYTAGLYLNKKSSDGPTLIKADENMAIRLVITSSKINSENMSEAILEGFTKSTGGKNAPIQDDINKLIETFSKEAIVPGNVFDLVYVPGKGIQSYKDGVLKSTITGLDFKQALFRIWLSEDPVSTGLKSGLLGK